MAFEIFQAIKKGLKNFEMKAILYAPRIQNNFGKLPQRWN